MLKTWLYGELLYLANSSPPLWREEFYRIKDRLLTLYGSFEGNHLQHIVKECYACDGTGIVKREMMVLGDWKTFHSGRCQRCDRGIFLEFWTVLRVYRIGRRQFHLPIGGKYYSRQSVPDLPFDEEIQGYIRHKTPRFYLHAEAALWLALLVDWRFFLKRFGKTGYSSWKKFTPMVILGTLLFDLRGIPGSIKRLYFKLQAFQQANCWHDFPELPGEAWERRYDCCNWCGISRWVAEDDIPF